MGGGPCQAPAKTAAVASGATRQMMLHSASAMKSAPPPLADSATPAGWPSRALVPRPPAQPVADAGGPAGAAPAMAPSHVLTDTGAAREMQRTSALPASARYRLLPVQLWPSPT